MDTALNLRDIPVITPVELTSCPLAEGEIYTRPEDIRVRLVSLDKACVLSRSEHVKTLLVINTANGFRSLYTKVLSVNPSSILIEGNLTIPMHAIYSVNIE
jgi:hypothetical protein